MSVYHVYLQTMRMGLNWCCICFQTRPTCFVLVFFATDARGVTVYPAVCCSVLQCVAVRCSVLQRAAVYCSVMRCIAV